MTNDSNAPTPRPDFDPANPRHNAACGWTITYDGPQPGVDVGGQHFDVGVPVDVTDQAVLEAVRRQGNFSITGG